MSIVVSPSCNNSNLLALVEVVVCDRKWAQSLHFACDELGRYTLRLLGPNFKCHEQEREANKLIYFFASTILGLPCC